MTEEKKHTFCVYVVWKNEDRPTRTIHTTLSYGELARVIESVRSGCGFIYFIETTPDTPVSYFKKQVVLLNIDDVQQIDISSDQGDIDTEKLQGCISL